MLECIKLIVWDLDGTLWKGVISEEKVILDDRIPELISGLTKAGIMNSVCSKNDFDDVRKYLIQEKLWDYFIFPSVNWTPKGKRLADLISAAGLRERMYYLWMTIFRIWKKHNFIVKESTPACRI